MTRRSFLLGVPPAIRTAAAQGGPGIERFARQLDDLRQRHKIPGFSAAVLREQRIRWTGAFGFQDLERQIPATAETPYRIASLTKTFASTLLMQLLEGGKLQLDEPIHEYLPKDSKLYEELRNPAIRIRHVFTHTTDGTPGERYRYNGFRFSALTYVIERLADKPFRDLLAERILDKLGMSRSVPGQDAEAERYQPVLAQLARPYKLDDAGRIIPSDYPPRRISASAGLISTVEDLARYDFAIDRHQLIKRETQELAWTPAVSTGGRTLPYGLGWFVQRRPDERLIWHYGYWPGSFSALLLKRPARNTTLFLLANSDGLSRPFPLGAGEVTASEFARLFLEMEEA